VLSDLVRRFKQFLARYDASYDLDTPRFQASWDIANFDMPGRTIDGYRVGKYFMLTKVSAWSGIKMLDDERCNSIAEASRRETFARLPAKIESAPAELKVR